MPEPGTKSGIRPRAAVVGILVSALLCLASTYNTFVVYSSILNISQFPIVIFMVILLLTVGTSLLSKIWGESILFDPDELLLITSMMFVASLVTTSGFMNFFFGLTLSPYYSATPENRWADFFHSNIPHWISPGHSSQEMAFFYEGLPPGVGIDWMVWLVPFFWWFLFLAALLLVCISGASLIRRRWVEHERLDFPIMTVVLDVARRSRPGSFLPGFMSSRLFWSGFGLAFGLVVWDIITFFVPGFPAPPLHMNWFTLARGFPTFDTHISFYAFAFAYFASLECLFSVWFFFLMNILQVGIFNRIGYSAVLGPGDPWVFGAAVGWQSYGAFLAIAGWTAWSARSHIRDTFRKAVHPATGIDDSREMLSHRASMLGIAGGIAFMIFWFKSAGMELTMGIPLVLMIFVVYFGIARIVSETGMLYVMSPATAQATVMHMVGTQAFSSASMSILALSYAWIARGSGFLGPPMAQISKLADATNGNARKFIPYLFCAVAVAFITSFFFTLHLGYARGAYNFNNWALFAGSHAVWNSSYLRMTDPTDFDTTRFTWIGIGAAVTALLFVLRYRFTWFRLHPIGMTISPTWPIKRVGFTIFVAWAVKALMMSLGGVTLYRRSQPFAIGLLVGWVAGIMVNLVVDVIWFPGGGHPIHWY